MKMFSVHDSKAEAYFSPMCFKTAGEAIRAFATSCEEPNSNFYKYPSDFTLVELGEYDETTGTISCHDKPRILSNASEFKRLVPQEKITQTLKPLIEEL